MAAAIGLIGVVLGAMLAPVVDWGPAEPASESRAAHAAPGCGR